MKIIHTLEKEEIPLQEGEWQEIPTHVNTLDFSLGASRLVAPLKQGKNIAAQIEYDGEVFFRKENFHCLSHLTYFPQNVLFHPLQQNRSGVFRSQYKEKPAKLPLLNFARANLSEKIAEAFVHPCSVAVEIAENLEAPDLEQVLRNIYEFVDEACDNMPHEQHKDSWNMNHLVQQYYETGRYGGDCKSIYTFFVGLANNLGLASRGVLGWLTGNKEKSLEGRGHYWPEVYIPESKTEGFWLPFDAANPKLNSFGEFDKNCIYYLGDWLPIFYGPKTCKMKVWYE